MTLENDDTTSTIDPADETVTGDSSPADDTSSPAGSTAEDIENELAPETPEEAEERARAERSKKRIADAENAEKGAEAARLAKRREREEAEERAKVQLEKQQAQALIRQAQSLVQELEAKKQAIAKGGYDALKALGIDYGDWTKKTLEDTSPDAVARQALEEARAAKQALADRDAADARRAAAARQEEGKKRFESFVDSNAEEFPDAALLPSKVFRSLADETAQEFIDEHGYAPTLGILAPLLDKKARELNNEQKTKAAKRSQATTTPSNGATTPQATPGLPANAPPNPRTLTPAHAGTRAKPPRQMTDEEIDEWARAELRNAMAADRRADSA